MTPAMANVEDYTIGCICAILDEAVALRSFFRRNSSVPKVEKWQGIYDGNDRQP
jgi:hypothetical protein